MISIFQSSFRIHRCITLSLVLALLLLLPIPAKAFDAATPSDSPEITAPADQPRMQPILPQQAIWAGVVVIVILGFFFAAAYIGPIVRYHMPEEMPPTHSHDEPPGASGHHGQTGLANPEPKPPAGVV